MALQLAGDGGLLVECRAVVSHAHAWVTGAAWQNLPAAAQHDPQVRGGGAVVVAILLGEHAQPRRKAETTKHHGNVAVAV